MRCPCCYRHECICSWGDECYECDECGEHFPNEEAEVVCEACGKAPLCGTCNEDCDGDCGAVLCQSCTNEMTLLDGPILCPLCAKQAAKLAIWASEKLARMNPRAA